LRLGRGADEVNAATERRAQARAAERVRLWSRIAQAIKDVAPALASGEPDGGLTRGQLAEVIAQLCGDKNAQPIHVTKRVMRMLHAQLSILQEKTGGQVAVPAIGVTTQRKSSPFRHDRIAQLAALRTVMDRFVLDLVERPKVGVEEAAGRLLFAAVIFGGLVFKPLLVALPKALNNALFGARGLLWLDLELEEGAACPRRWFPDPVTQCLILNWKKAGHAWPIATNSPTTTARLVAKTLAAFGCSGRETQLSWLIDANLVRLRIEMPALLVDFLESPQRGQSLPARAWWRLLCNYHLSASHGGEAELQREPVPSDNFPARTNISPGTADDQHVLRLLSKALNPTGSARNLKPAAAVRALNALRVQANAGILAGLLIDWSVWIISGTDHRRLRPSSVRRYLSAFAAPLLASAGELDPRGESVDELGSRYEQTLASIRNPLQRQMASIALQHFHQFLTLGYDVPPVVIDGVVTGVQQVNANTLSDSEYARIRTLIDQSNLRGRSKRMLRVMCTFLYRLGLRRNELAWLRLADIQSDPGDKRPLLWVHTHPKSSLKTQSSLRRLALGHLMPADERRELWAWKAIRLRELGAHPPHDALLFCEQGADTQRVSDHEIDILVTLARAVTGDSGVVLHTFRHAFASHLFVQVQHAEWARLQDPAHRDHMTYQLPWQRPESSADPTKVLRRHFVMPELPRGAAYQLAIHAGHLDPTETLHTYVHHQDYLAHLYLRELTATLPNKLWATLAGISPQALAVRHSRKGGRRQGKVLPHLVTPSMLLRRAKLKKPPGVAAPKLPQGEQRLPVAEDELEGLGLDALYRALAGMNVSLSPAAREAITGIDVELLKRMLQNARFLAQRKTRTRHKAGSRSRHLVPKSPRPRPRITRSPQLDQIGPALPKTRADLAEARLAFSGAMRERSGQMLKTLLDLLGRTSRSDPTLVFGDLHTLNVAVDTLKALGLGYSQMTVVIRSMPKGTMSVRAWQKAIRKDLLHELPIEVPRMGETPITRTGSPAGRLALKVVTGARRASGWRVGAYYAVCAMAALLGVSLREINADWAL